MDFLDFLHGGHVTVLAALLHACDAYHYVLSVSVELDGEDDDDDDGELSL